jgi:hypothetical protein
VRFDGQCPDQLVGVADPDLHAPEPGLREVFVIKPAAAAHAGTGLRKCRSRNDDQIYFGRFARHCVPVRFGDPEGPRTECPGHVIEEPHRVAPDPGDDDPPGGAPPGKRLLRLGFVGQGTEKRHAPRRPERLRFRYPAEDPPGCRGTFFGGEGQVLFFHRRTQLFFSHKTLLFGIKFPAVSIVILQTMAIFASGNTKL